MISYSRTHTQTIRVQDQLSIEAMTARLLGLLLVTMTTMILARREEVQGLVRLTALILGGDYLCTCISKGGLFDTRQQNSRYRGSKLSHDSGIMHLDWRVQKRHLGNDHEETTLDCDYYLQCRYFLDKKEHFRSSSKLHIR